MPILILRRDHCRFRAPRAPRAGADRLQEVLDQKGMTGDFSGRTASMREHEEGTRTSLVRQGAFQEADSGKDRYCFGIPQY